MRREERRRRGRRGAPDGSERHEGMDAIKGRPEDGAVANVGQEGDKVGERHEVREEHALVDVLAVELVAWTF